VTGQVEVSRADLAWALKAVLPHVSRDDLLPALTSVRFEADGGYLYLVATDRYTLGVAKLTVTAPCWPDHPLAASVGHQDAQEIARKVKGNGKRDGTAELCFYEDGELALDWRSRYASQPGDYVDWRGLLARYLRRPAALPHAKFGYNPAYLARFQPAARDHAPLTFMPVSWPSTYGETPLAATAVLGERFTGLVMSARIDSDGTAARGVLAGWRAALPEAKETPS
jgi:hypothetical protein